MNIDQVAAISPYGGRPIASHRIKKYFVVSTRDRLNLLNHVKDLHKRSSEPKKITIYDTDAHAQYILNDPEGRDLSKQILAFICEP